jgi:hypothetical protein
MRPVNLGIRPLCSSIVVALWLPLGAHAGGCEEPVAQTVRLAHERVTALDSSRQDLRWMHEQLQLIDAACLRGGEVEAVWRLEGVLERMRRPVPAHLHVATGYQDAPLTIEAESSLGERRGRSMLKADPAPSRLSTSMVPP